MVISLIVVISSSRTDNRPHVVGTSVTSNTLFAGGVMNHSFGMDAICRAFFSAASSCQEVGMARDRALKLLDRK
jgi:hypothetical protein